MTETPDPAATPPIAEDYVGLYPNAAPITAPAEQVDLSQEADGLAQSTANGWQEGDPTDQPSQDPADLPEGTETNR